MRQGNACFCRKLLFLLQVILFIINGLTNKEALTQQHDCKYTIFFPLSKQKLII